MHLGTQTGSLINHVYSNMKADEPQVGMGATILSWSDRTAGTIIEVGEKHFVVQADKATRTDQNGMSDCQSYDYTPDPNGATYTIKRVSRGKAKGQWRVGGSKDGNGVIIGVRRQYYDYSF